MHLQQMACFTTIAFLLMLVGDSLAARLSQTHDFDSDSDSWDPSASNDNYNPQVNCIGCRRDRGCTRKIKCETGQKLDPRTCKCVCIATPPTCPANMEWNPQTCQLECSTKITCPPGQKPHNVTCECGCALRPADVVFIVDASGSVGQDNFDMTLDFIKNIVMGFTIGPNDMQVGMITFDSSPYPQFQLKDFDNQNTLLDAINKTKYTGQGTLTHLALQAAQNSFLPGNGLRANSAKIAIVITDGNSQDITATAQQADRLRNGFGVTIFAIGVGTGINNQELNSIASDPDSDHVFLVSNYGVLDLIRNTLKQSVCAAGCPTTQCPSGKTLNSKTCTCECMDIPYPCPPNKQWNNDTCQFECKRIPYPCPPNKQWDPDTCKYVCKLLPYPCPSNKVIDPGTCLPVCKIVTNCQANQKWDNDKCTCVCVPPRERCPTDQRFNPTSCEYECIDSRKVRNPITKLCECKDIPYLSPPNKKLNLDTCEYECMDIPYPCPPNKQWNNDTCQYECKRIPYPCPPNKEWNPDTCKYVCKPLPYPCPQNKIIDPDTCLPVCKRVTNCRAGLKWDNDTCTCVGCPRTQCPPGKTMNSKTCTCVCKPLPYPCPQNKIIDPDTCLPVCKRVTNCQANLKWDNDTCACVCVPPRERCPTDQRFNPTSCDYECIDSRKVRNPITKLCDD